MSAPVILGTQPDVHTSGPLVIGVTGAIVIPVVVFVGGVAIMMTKFRTRTVIVSDVIGK